MKLSGYFFMPVYRCAQVSLKNIPKQNTPLLTIQNHLGGSDIVSKTNIIDTIELLYSYLAGMNGVAYTNAQCIL
jgi:hypothetical protein